MTFRFEGKRARLALLLCALARAAMAQELLDPTMPPADPGSAAKAAASELRSIIISPTRRAAIIGGQTLELGAKLGDVRLIEVNTGSVVLEGVQGRRVLTLFPSIKTNKVNDATSHEK